MLKLQIFLCTGWWHFLNLISLKVVNERYIDSCSALNGKMLQSPKK